MRREGRFSWAQGPLRRRSAWNIVYGSDSRGGPRFVLIDGFGEKHFIPRASMSRTLNAWNTHKLYRRMREQVQREVPLPPV